MVVSLTAGHLRFTDRNGKVQEFYSLAGESRWFPPVKHTVEKIGDEPFNAVYVYIKGKPTTSAGDPKGAAPMSAELLTDPGGLWSDQGETLNWTRPGQPALWATAL